MHTSPSVDVRGGGYGEGRIARSHAQGAVEGGRGGCHRRGGGREPRPRARAAEDAEDRPVEPLRPRLRQVVRRRLHARNGAQKNDTRGRSSTTSPSARSTRAPPPRSRPRRGTTSSCSSRRRRRTRSRSSTTREIYQAVEKKHGKMIDLGAQVDVQPEDEEVLRVLRLLRPRSRATTARTSGSRSGSPTGPDTWEDLRKSAARRSRTSSAIPVGHRALAGARHEHGDARACSGRSAAPSRTPRGSVAINSKQTIEALKYVRALFKEAHDAGGLHLGSLVEQPRHPRREALLRRATRSR